MEKNFTLSAFAEPITALPDTPNLSASELKRRFQAPSDELREVHNALAKTVQGITDATYPETVSESMLTADLAGKINGKAEQSDMTAVQTALAQKCEVYLGSYTGSGGSNTSKTIELGFTPQAVLVFNDEGKTCTGFNYYDCTGGLALKDKPVIGASKITALEIVENGFKVHNHSYSSNNDMTVNTGKHYFIAFK